MVPARRFIAEIAPHDKSTSSQAGQFASDVASGLGSQNYYDPDRAAFQQMLAQQLGGSGAQTGSQMSGADYGLGQGQDPYSPGPGINSNLGTFGPNGQPIGDQPQAGSGYARPSGPPASVPNSGSRPTVAPRTPAASPSPTGEQVPAGGVTTQRAQEPKPIGFQGPYSGNPNTGITSYPRPGGSDGSRSTTTVPMGQATPPQGSADATSGGLGGARDATGALVFGGLSQMLADPNIPQATKDAIQQQGALTARAGYGGAAEGIQRNAAATGNASGTAASLAQLGRAQAGTLADLNRQSNIGFEAEAQRRKETALSGLSNYYGQTSSNFNTLAGMRGALAGAPVGSQTGARNLTKGVQTGSGSGTQVNWV